MQVATLISQTKVQLPVNLRPPLLSPPFKTYSDNCLRCGPRSHLPTTTFCRTIHCASFVGTRCNNPTTTWRYKHCRSWYFHGRGDDPMQHTNSEQGHFHATCGVRGTYELDGQNWREPRKCRDPRNRSVAWRQWQWLLLENDR